MASGATGENREQPPSLSDCAATVEQFKRALLAAVELPACLAFCVRVLPAIAYSKGTIEVEPRGGLGLGAALAPRARAQGRCDPAPRLAGNGDLPRRPNPSCARIDGSTTSSSRRSEALEEGAGARCVLVYGGGRALLSRVPACCRLEVRGVGTAPLLLGNSNEVAECRLCGLLFVEGAAGLGPGGLEMRGNRLRGPEVGVRLLPGARALGALAEDSFEAVARPVEVRGKRPDSARTPARPLASPHAALSLALEAFAFECWERIPYIQ
eukprot:tig00022075_g23576.t1